MRQPSARRYGKIHGKGQALTEYGLVLALVAIASIGALAALGVVLSDGLTSLSGEFIIPAGNSGDAGAGTGNPGDPPSSQGSPSAGDGVAPPSGSVSVTLANGKQVYLDQMPPDVGRAVETMGANGTTQLLASQLEALAKQLLAEGAISPQEASQLSALANQGYVMADIQGLLLDTAKQYGSDVQGFNFAPITYNGKEYNNADSLANIIGMGEEYVNGRRTGREIPGPELVKLQTLIQQSQNLAIMQDPAVNTLVNTLANQIQDISKSVENVVCPDYYPNNFEEAQQNIASSFQQTALNATGICNAGGGTTNGITCH